MKRLSIIINPSSGMKYPVLYTLNKVLSRQKVSWDVHVTKNKEDVSRFVKLSVAENADVIVIYGGDGTVQEAAGALIGGKTPLLILPGGTANVISNELRIAQDVEKAVNLCLGQHRIREIDVGQMGHKYFLIRVSSGFEAEVVRETKPDIKTRIGWLAYALNSLKAALKTTPSLYQLTLDGKEYEERGLACIVANSGNLGLPGISISSKIQVDDGLLDVIIINHTDLKNIFEGRKNIFRGFLRHWQVREIEITSDPKQHFQSDGEILRYKSVHIKILPKSLKLITP